MSIIHQFDLFFISENLEPIFVSTNDGDIQLTLIFGDHSAARVLHNDDTLALHIAIEA